MLRLVLGTIAGLICAFITIAMIEYAGVLLHPPPPWLDLANPDDMARLMGSMPLTAKVLVAVAWVIGALDGGIVAGIIARQRGKIAAGIIGALVVLGVILNARAIPHPMWMLATGVLLPIPAALLGAWLAQRLVPTSKTASAA